MNPGAALDLRDIHLPPEPSWWPPAPGWWLLATLLVVLAVIGWRHGRRRWRRHRQRRELLSMLADLRARHPVSSEPVVLLAAASELLRRAGKRHAPESLTLHGEAWLGFLDRGMPGQPFTTGPGRLLLDGPYRRSLDPDDVAMLLELIERRLRRFPEESRP